MERAGSGQIQAADGSEMSEFRGDECSTTDPVSEEREQESGQSSSLTAEEGSSKIG